MQFNPLHFTDQNNEQIQLGDLVKVTKGPNKGAICIFVFCIPQHRFGFLYLKFYERLVENNNNKGYDFNMFPEDFVTMESNLQFYYTPKNRLTVSSIFE
jgi:hypothetical protein